jgi:transcriptional regulator with XRE-family HTH domain
LTNETPLVTVRDVLRIKELRKAAGMSRLELAYKAGLSIDTIQRLENTGTGSMKSLRKLADVFGLEVPELFSTEKAS